VSSRHTRSLFGVMLAVVFAFSAVIVAPASAKLTKSQKVHIRKQLKRAIHKNPKLIRSKAFIKKASLVDFTLPVFIRLRENVVCGNPAQGYPYACAGNTHPNPQTGQASVNPNSATIDLGPSLGQRQISLGGSLPAEIKFHDSFDGGALGNVDLKILQDTSGNSGLTTTSIPLLWNTQVTGAGSHWFLNGGNLGAGCGDFTNAAAAAGAPTGGATNNNPGSTAPFSLTPPNPGFTLPSTPTLPGVPYFAGPGNPAGFVDEYPGVDDVTKIQAGTVTGDPDIIGTDPNPFPYAPGGQQPGAPLPGVQSYAGNSADTVLRTGPLKLNIAQPGNEVTGIPGSQDSRLGQSGGQANLFGNIPGKGTAVDVTVNLDTKINSILREVDPEPQTLIQNQNWPAEAFTCRQAWTGYVQNYIQGVHLQGSLKISPAIDPDGRLRIAKTILNSPDSAQVALAACLSPNATYADHNATNNSDIAPSVLVPADPINELSRRGAPSVPCNTSPTQLVTDTHVNQGVIADPPYSTLADGSQVSVSGNLSVSKVDAEVVLGGR
jgi:hypothetical protein